MSLIVHKYGGKSLSSPEKIKKIAEYIKEVYSKGHKIIVVVSAIANTTEELYDLAHSCASNPNKRELDMLLTTGERQSGALLSIALNALNCPAKSFTGSQVGIITDNNHSSARIVEIKGYNIDSTLQNNEVAIVSGFQGISINKEITTLELGGTEMTAVLLAYQFNADFLEIYSDVDGVYEGDPKYFPKAEKYIEISHDFVLHLAHLGAKVINYSALEFAKNYGITLHLADSRKPNIKGTIVLENPFFENKPKGIVINKKAFLIKSYDSSIFKSLDKHVILLYCDSKKAVLSYDNIFNWNCYVSKCSGLKKSIIEKKVLISFIGIKLNFDYLSQNEFLYLHLKPNIFILIVNESIDYKKIIEEVIDEADRKKD